LNEDLRRIARAQRQPSATHLKLNRTPQRSPPHQPYRRTRQKPHLTQPFTPGSVQTHLTQIRSFTDSELAYCSFVIHVAERTVLQSSLICKELF
jgi:hypothetical protein